MSRAGVCEVNHCTVGKGEGGGNVIPTLHLSVPKACCSDAMLHSRQLLWLQPADEDKMTFTVAPAGDQRSTWRWGDIISPGSFGRLSWGVTPPGVWLEAARSPCF